MNLIRSLAAACACAAALVPAGAHACSLAPFPASRPGVYLVGTAMADTLLAGTGGREYGTGPGHSGPGGDRAVYGQVVRVERLGGSRAASLPAGTDRVVLVAWDYGPDCRTVVRTETARWVQPGTRGLFWAGLRPREQWVNGLPTMDVGNPYHLPYTFEVALREAENEQAGADVPAVMSVDQAFDFLGVLPLWEEHEANEEAAALSLLAWAREHPDLARRFPASMSVSHVEYGLRHTRLKRVEPPLAGSYRFTVSVDGDAPRTFFARTRSAPTTEWDPWRSLDDPYFPGVDAPLRGYSLLLTATTTADSLPIVCGPDRDIRREGYVSVLAAPDSVTDGVQLWRGEMELGLLADAFPFDSVLVRLNRAEDQRMSQRIMAGERNEGPVVIPGRFLLRPDGSVTMEQVTVLGDGRRVVIRGERISRVTVPDPG
ncbi:hypothetical protein [Longimicrobium sp.]|uniref:hypothetical protein n=1 Tax=Longimicrobium sp. TaxID=2029185 RepID=UPI003B3AA099